MQHSTSVGTLRISTLPICRGFHRLTTKSSFFSRTSLLLLFALAGTLTLHASTSSTVLTLSDGYAHANSVTTLTATVSSNGSPAFPGLVFFCNADAKYCTDGNVLGQAQLTSSGAATLKLRLPIGIHHIAARFHGTQTIAASVSQVERLRVTGLITTSTTISVTGEVATAVVRSNNLLPATGTVAFYDTAISNSPIAFAPLSSTSQSLISFTRTSTNPIVYFGDPQIGDFNNDGIPDIVANNNGQEIVLFGRGDGTFPSTLTLPAAGGAAHGADFNGDGILDIAVNEGARPIIILLGQPNGSFVQSSTVQPSGAVAANSCGDLNNDGYPDIIVTTNDGVVQIFWGKGDGTFDAPTTVSIHPGIPSQGVTIGDFNGDGKVDFAASDWDSKVYIELSNGDKTFTRSAVLTAGSYPVGLEAADFNHDGKADVAVANAFSNSVTAFLGNGDGSFKTPSTTPTGNHPNAVEIADFNGDGLPDLVTANAYDDTVSILLSNGDGTFTTRLTPSVHGDPYQLAVAALKGDGVPHIVAGSSILLEQAATTTTATTTDLDAGIQQVSAIYAADGQHRSSTSGTVPITPAP